MTIIPKMVAHNFLLVVFNGIPNTNVTFYLLTVTIIPKMVAHNFVLVVFNGISNTNVTFRRLDV